MEGAGLPEAVGTGVSKLVDINPAIGLLVGALFIALIAVTKWGLDGWKEARLTADRHLKYVQDRAAEDRKDRDTFELMADRLEEIRDRGRRG